MAVKLVTDSTCDLPPEVAERWGITVIPCNVHFDAEVFKDGVDITPDEFYQRLASTERLPTTAQPSVNDFLQVYRKLCADGDDVVSIHVSAKLSGTLNSAEQACSALGEDGHGGSVDIIDSGLASVGLGLAVLEAAGMVGSGSSADRVVQGVRDALPSISCFFALDTLEYLQRGGRIGRASAFLGSLLSVKPILTIREGEAHPVERPRTRDKARRRLVEMVRGLAPLERMAIVHSTAPDEAESLKNDLADLAPADRVVVARFGPVVGTYLGPGAVGVGVMSAR